MPRFRKINPRATLWNLSAEQRSAVLAYSQDHTLVETAEWMSSTLGFVNPQTGKAVSRTTLGEWLKRERTEEMVSKANANRPPSFGESARRAEDFAAQLVKQAGLHQNAKPILSQAAFAFLADSRRDDPDAEVERLARFAFSLLRLPRREHSTQGKGR